MIKTVKISLVIIVLIGLIFSLFFLLHKKNDQFSLSIFSWSSEEISSNREELLSNLIDYKFNRIFQSFPSDLPEEEIVSFVLELTEKNIDVYALEGTPEWAFEPSGEGMIKQLQRIVQINQLLPEKQKIKGFVFDVEPYQLDDFEWEDEAIQHSFISAMKNVYEVAKQEGLELIVVVPYFYDTKGYIEVLKRFIHDTASEIAVMNYYREHEIEHLSFEAQEAKKAKKPLTTIYEFKAPGEFDLTEKNTYFHEGVSAALKNAEQLIDHYNNQTIHIAFHDYRAFREVIQRE